MNAPKKSALAGIASFMGRKSNTPSTPQNSKSKNSAHQEKDSNPLLSFDQRFPCPLHPSQPIKYFIPYPIEQGKLPLFKCEHCAQTSPNLNLASLSGFDEVCKILEEGTVMMPIQEIGEYFSNKYIDVRSKPEGNNVNIGVIENFMENADELREEIFQCINEEKQQLAMKAQSLIEIFTYQVYSLRDYISLLLSSELDTFVQNIQYAKVNSQKFMEYVNSIKSTPSFLEIEKQTGELASNQDLNLFAYNHTLKLNELLSVLTVPEVEDIFDPKNDAENKSNEFTNRYKYAKYLIRKVRETSISPPKNPLLEKMDYNLHRNTQQPNQFLMEIIKEMNKIDIPNTFKIENSIQNISKNINYESFLNKSYNFKSFEIDTDDFFNTDIPSSIKCLHFYSPAERNLHLYNLPKICLNLKMTDLQGIFPPLIKVPFPKDLHIPRTVKTISTPDGLIYFIGGENSVQTLSFEYRALINPPRRPPTKTSAKNSPSEERKEAKQDSLVDQQKRKASSSNEGLAAPNNGDSLGQAVINFRAKLNKSRYGHSLVYCDGSIYVVGGFESGKDDECLVECERYIIKEDRWIEIGSCNYGVSDPSLMVFDDKYIYKYGGYIGYSGEICRMLERYNMVRDEWIEIPLISDSQIEMFAGAKSSTLQINSQEIMILGGQTETFLSSDSCYFINAVNTKGAGLKVLEEAEEGHEDMWDVQIPDSEGRLEERMVICNRRLPLDERYVAQSLIHQGKLFCLALKSNIDNSVTENVFSYDGKHWSILI